MLLPLVGMRSRYYARLFWHLKLAASRLARRYSASVGSLGSSKGNRTQVIGHSLCCNHLMIAPRPCLFSLIIVSSEDRGYTGRLRGMSQPDLGRLDVDFGVPTYITVGPWDGPKPY